MKCLVTGGAGFIGSHLVDRLLNLGHQVAIFDSMRSGKEENINPKAEFTQGDIRDKVILAHAFEKFQPEIVFHLAAQNEVPYSMEHPFEDVEMNILGTMNLMEVCHTYGVRKVIYSNTGGAFYGETEEVNLPISEDHPILKPTSFYGVSKGCAETYIKLYANLYGISWVSLRYSNVYGPRQDGNKEAGIIAIFTQKLLNKETPIINGQGNHTRDYIFVEDVIDANIAALDLNTNDYFNIATEIETSNIEVFNAIEFELQTGIKPTFGPPRPGDPLRNSLSVKKAKEKLGWTPKTYLKEGVHKTITFYKEKQTQG